MADKCYRVQYTAQLSKLTLAIKIECEVEVIWKRGQKKAQSGKVPLLKGEAHFNKNMTISCNMIFNSQTKAFQQKMTNFTIILTSQKGKKQAGQVQVDVSQMINQKKTGKKQYQKKLCGCPDKNAILSFSLTFALKQQISMDAVSQYSYLNKQNSKLQPQNNDILTIKCRQDKSKQNEYKQKLKLLQQQNKKLRQQLKVTQKLKRNNEQLHKKIKSEQFNKSQQIKSKISKYKTEIQKIKSQIRKNKKIQDQNNQIQKQLLSTKVKIMKAFNYAAQFGGTELLDMIQAYSGFQEK